MRQARQFGLSLREIKTLLHAPDARHAEARCQKVRQLLADKVAFFDRRILELREFRDTLAGLQGTCERWLAERHGRDCPVFNEDASPRSR